MSRFSIFQDCQYDRVLNFRVTEGLTIFVNMTGLWAWVGMQLWKGFDYSRIPNMPVFVI